MVVLPRISMLVSSRIWLDHLCHDPGQTFPGSCSSSLLQYTADPSYTKVKKGKDFFNSCNSSNHQVHTWADWVSYYRSSCSKISVTSICITCFPCYVTVSECYWLGYSWLSKVAFSELWSWPYAAGEGGGKVNCPDIFSNENSSHIELCKSQD